MAAATALRRRGSAYELRPCLGMLHTSSRDTKARPVYGCALRVHVRVKYGLGEEVTPVDRQPRACDLDPRIHLKAPACTAQGQCIRSYASWSRMEADMCQLGRARHGNEWNGAGRGLFESIEAPSLQLRHEDDNVPARRGASWPQLDASLAQPGP
jgi:hypothetical protein